MQYNKRIEEVSEIIIQLKAYKKELKSTEKLSLKAFNMNIRDNTPSQMQKASTGLNWACMNLDKQKTVE